jgi:tetratricopeptide (TPR) repeat protein
MKRLMMLVILVASLFAQDVRHAQVEGQVLNMEGKPIADALVVYTRVGQNKKYEVRTDANGRYIAIGLDFGRYHVEITGPSGRHIYSGEKILYGGDQQSLNYLVVDLSILPPKVPLKPLRVQALEAAQNAGQPSPQLTSKEWLELIRKENALIVRMNRLVPPAQATIHAQNWEQASAILRELIAINPYKWEFHQNLAVILGYSGKFNEAIGFFEQGIKAAKDALDPETDRREYKSALSLMLTGEADVYAQLGDFNKAIARYDEALELESGSAFTYLHLCTAQFNSGNTEAAIVSCKKAISIDPARPEFYQTLAAIQSNLERYDDAAHTYDLGILAARKAMKFKVYPEDTKTVVGQMLFAQANAYFQMKKYSKAADLFSQAAPLHSYPALAYFNLCVTLYDMNKMSAATNACNRAISIDSKLADAYYVKASALYGKESARSKKDGASPEVIAALEKYLELDPDGFYAAMVKTMLRELHYVTR